MSVEGLSAVLQEIEQANGLPNAHYISSEMYALEREHVFFKSWSALAFESDVSKHGDAFPVDFLGVPLLVVRTRDGKINVFQNTCRHRGMILVDKPTHLKGPIRCPYHSWCYDYNGALVRTPYVGGVNIDTHKTIKNDELGLFQVRSFIWQGVIFVNLSGDALNFEEANADVIERWKEFEKPYHLGGEASRFDMTLATNWKLAVENYCESYHLPWIHPELNAISPIDVHYNIDNHSDYAGQGSRNYNQLVGEGGQKFPDFEECKKGGMAQCLMVVNFRLLWMARRIRSINGWHVRCCRCKTSKRLVHYLPKRIVQSCEASRAVFRFH